MRTSLYAKLAATLIGLSVAVGVLHAAFTVYATRGFLQEVTQRINRDLARELMMERPPVEGRMDQATIERMFEHYMHINPAVEIYLLDAGGRITAFAAPHKKIKRHHVDLAPLHAFLSDEQGFPLLGDDPRHPSRRKAFSVAAWPSADKPEQYLYVILGGESFDSVQRLVRDSYFLQLILSAAVASLLFGLAAGLIVFYLLTRRLRRLAAKVDDYRRSDFRSPAIATSSAAFCEDGGDEIDRLARAFDELAARTLEQMHQLEHKDTLRRHLIANVSHDLRTPLAALQGYLETILLKGADLGHAQRQSFLETAFKHSQRLTRLVAELFELSKLEANETRAVLEPVSMGELVQDVAQKYRLVAEAADLQLDTHIEADLPLVRADVSLIDRVLVNLLENAIDHTPAGGEVRVSVESEGRDVRVRVYNSGDPIPAEVLPHLFERFYQAPERRSRGAGLGLAIVRRILEMHGTEIQVSRPQKTGNIFEFALTHA